MVNSPTKIIQVTNVAPQATKDQMQTLFSYFGKIEDIRLFPTAREITIPTVSRICFIRFQDSNSATVALHLGNTVFIDRALIVIKVDRNEIPEESEAMEILKKEGLLPIAQSVLDLKPQNSNMSNVTATLHNQMESVNLKQHNLPPYPQLLSSYDLRKIDITRRTILVYDYNPEIVSPTELLNYFNNVAEVKYMRLCNRSNDKNSIHVLMEFTEHAGVVAALKLNNSEINGQRLVVTHSTQAIVAPIAKTNELAQLEIEEAMKRLKEAQNLIANSIDPVATIMGKEKDKDKSTSRSRSRDRSVSRKKSRSRSRHRSRSRSRHRSRSRRHRSRSLSRRRSHKRRTRSRSRSRSRSKSRRHRSHHRRSRSRSRSRSKDRHRRSHRHRRSDSLESVSERKKSRHRSLSRHKRSTKSQSKSRSRSRERRRKHRSRHRSKTRSRSRSKHRRSSHTESTTPKTSPSRKKVNNNDETKVQIKSDLIDSHFKHESNLNIEALQEDNGNSPDANLESVIYDLNSDTELNETNSY